MSGDYEVGYGRPPRHSQFKKGQSGNSRGRPRKIKSDSMQEIVVSQLARQVGTAGGTRMSACELMARAMIAEACKGNVRAAEWLRKFVPSVEPVQPEMEFTLVLEEPEQLRLQAERLAAMAAQKLPDEGKDDPS